MINDTEESSRLLERVQALQAELGELGIEAEMLDGLIQDCASEQASEVNNNGMPAQLAFLLRGGWTPADIIFNAKRAKEEESEF